jgi:hypothetical protein
MQSCIFVGDWASEKAQSDILFKSLYQIKQFFIRAWTWSPDKSADLRVLRTSDLV